LPGIADTSVTGPVISLRADIVSCGPTPLKK